MAKKNRERTDNIVDCACVIHGKGYDWMYVERLYNSLCRTLQHEVRFHVYTEHDRSVPPHMIKHCVDDLGISGPKKSWWYKIQLFNSEHHSGNLLYFDLDTVIARDITWIVENDPKYLWTIRDFRYLQRQNLEAMNSSVMWFNVPTFSYIYNTFVQSNLQDIMRRFPGDQDYIYHTLNVKQRRFLPDEQFQSYRWQVMDGGFDFKTRRHHSPGAGSAISPTASVVVFHGSPKPHEVRDPIIQDLWK